VIPVYLLGIDVGTTGSKAIVFNTDGDIKGYGFREYDVLCEKPGLAEQDAEKVWTFVKQSVKQAVAKSGVKNIKALSVSVQGDAVIPVDKNIRPLHNALLGMDYRSKEQADFCSGLLGERNLFNITGMRPHPMNSLTKILWFRGYMPDLFSQTYKFMTYSDFIMSKLGSGRAVIDQTMASRTMMFDIKQKQWSKQILDKLELDDRLFSEVIPSGILIGKINSKLADELGISRNVFLVSGGHDQTCAALGAGVVKENIAVDSHGTAEVLSTAFYKPKINDFMYNGYYPCYLHAKEGMYFTFSLNHIGGILLKWYRDNLGYEEVKEAQEKGISAYKLMETKAPNGPSSVLVLPHFNGSGTPTCDFASKGAILGLTMSTTRHDIVKGILDSLVYELKINMETLKKAGIRINEMRCVGGASRSPVWLNIKSNVTNCRVVTMKVHEAACLGAAILAGSASGIYSSVEEGVENTVKLEKVYEPDEKMYRLYEEKYSIYKGIYDILRDVNKKL